MRSMLRAHALMLRDLSRDLNFDKRYNNLFSIFNKAYRTFMLNISTFYQLENIDKFF